MRMLKAFLLGYVLLTGEAVIRANCNVRLHFGGVSALFVPELPFDIAVHGISDVALGTEYGIALVRTSSCNSRKPLLLAPGGVAPRYSLMALSATEMPLMSPLAITRRSISKQVSK